MFAFFAEEFREWRERRMKRTMVLGAFALAIVSAVSMLQPLLVALASTLVFVGFGWTEGNRYQSALSSRRLLVAFPVAPRAIAAGKALSSLATWSFTAMVLSPPLALSAIAWGVSGRALAACALSWLVCYYASLCVGFLSSLVFVKSEGLIGAVFVIAWLVSSLAVKSLAPSNPFIQVWDILKEEGGASPFLGMGATTLAASALLGVAALALARLRRGKHE